MMIQASFMKPAKLSALNSHRVTMRRNWWNHANRRSIFHLLLYRRNSRPSWVALFLRFLRCGAINLIRSLCNCLSNPSSSYALSPTNLLGFLRRKRLLRVFSTSFVSWREALSICRTIGRPWRSAIAMTLVPLPRLVGPIYRPPFLPPQRWHRWNILINPTSLSFEGLLLKPSGSCPWLLTLPIFGNIDGMFGMVDIDQEDHARELPYVKPIKYRLKQPIYLGEGVL